MTQKLHKVRQDELPVLRDWLAKYLPDSVKMYGTVCNELAGKWKGPTYYTLGWPDILAAGDGPADLDRSFCPEFFNFIRHTCAYSPNPEHLEVLLTHPDFLDWSKPIQFSAMCHENVDVVQRISDATGTKYSRRFVNYLMSADRGDIQPIPVPEGSELRSLDPDLNAEYVASQWPHRRKGCDLYIKKLIEIEPSVGIFDKTNGDCLAWQLTSEYGFPSILQVRDDARGRGLGSCVASQLAQILFKDSPKIYSGVIVNNQVSVKLHQKIGYKPIGNIDWFYHAMTGEKLIASLDLSYDN